MDPSRFRRLMDILGEAMLLSPADRSRFLDQACEGDEALAAEAHALIEEAAATSFAAVTERLGIAVGRAAEPLREAQRALPAKIGPYRVLGVLGEGGMGLVYHAEQTAPIRREVALKVVRGGLLGEHALARFEAERQSLAVMNHPGIARIFDAGTTDEGVPYFAMELVLGEPLTSFCDQEELALDARLELFQAVCAAVQHAHLNGVIHRDLKPSNVLVAKMDGQAHPRVIDFGIAKAVEATAGPETMHTAFGAVIGTLEYMSPEQAAGGTAAVDTRSDVYSLGVILYELTTGALPFDSSALRDAGIVEVQRLIRDTPAPNPSQRFRTTEEREVIARARGTDPRSLERRLASDLGWVILKALEKEPGRRYQSAGDLARDIGRLRRNEPVEAGPPSRSYRARRFVRRHRMGVVAASTVLVALIAGMALATTGLVRARQAQLRAEGEAERATLIKDFLTGMLAGARPENASGREVRVIDMVDSMAARLDRNEVFPDDPLLLADVAHAVGETYRALDDAERAIPLFQRAVELKRAAPGDNRENVLISLNKLSESQAQLGDLSRAITTQEEVVALAADVMGTDARQYSMWLNNLANMQADVGELESAASSMREALEIARRVLGEDDAGVATPLNNLASILYDLGECDAAIPLHEESIALRRRHHGEPSAEVAIALGNYALALSCVGRHADAEVAAAEAVPMAATVFGSEHQRTAAARLTLVRIFLETNRAEAAEPLAREAILALSAVNARHWRTGTARAHLGDALIALHRGAEGVIELEAAYDILLETMAADIPRLRTLADRIADYYEAEGELALASDWRLRASGASGE